MSRQWPKPVMALAASRSSSPTDNGAAWAGVLSHVEDHLAERSSWLHDHMLHEHGRDGREIDGLPLADLHRFEHVEQAMGLSDLRHHHPEVLGDADDYLPPSRAWSVPA